MNGAGSSDSMRCVNEVVWRTLATDEKRFVAMPVNLKTSTITHSSTEHTDAFAACADLFA